MPEDNINSIVTKLELQPHPEGGYYKEVYRSEESILKSALPDRFMGERNYLTSIYFLLEEKSYSAFHRIQSDELWYFHKGDPVEIHVITPEGQYYSIELGVDTLQAFIPAQCWFAAKTKGAYSLVSCAVAPGFDFADFELAQKAKLLLIYPQHKTVIEQFCK